MAHRLLYLSLALTSVGVVCAAVFINLLGKDLPDASSILESNLDIPLQVFSSEGLLIAEFGSERRDPVPIGLIPETLINAVLASEDSGFFEHPGIEITGIIRAAFSNLTSSGPLQGASTITQQVARNFFLSPEQTYARKIKEILLALRLERNLSKDKILELYLNKIYLGQRAYGFGAAAEIYYATPLSELSLAQYAMLAGLPKAPSRDNPASNPERAAERRAYVLDRMLSLEMIEQTEYEIANAAPVSAQSYRPNTELEAPFVAEMARSYLLDKYGEQAYSTGYRVYTTIKAELQIAADKALRTGLVNYDRRHGFRGAVAQLGDEVISEMNQLLLGVTLPPGQILDPNPVKTQELRTELTSRVRELLLKHPDSGEFKVAIVLSVDALEATTLLRSGISVPVNFETMHWAAPYVNDNRVADRPTDATDVLAPGDVVYIVQPEAESNQTGSLGQWSLGQLPGVSGALISMNPATGAIQALSGGFDYYVSKYNRVEQAQRQPGSNIKPFIYAAALDQGYTPASLISGAPIVIQDTSQGTIWRPENYSGKFFGPTRMRRALSLSLNLVSVRILRALGIQPTIGFMEEIGIDRNGLPNGLSLALGAGTLSPMNMANAYNALANGGNRTTPHVIDWIEDANGNIVAQQVQKIACRHCDPLNRIGKPIETGIVNDRIIDEEAFGEELIRERFSGGLTITEPTEPLPDSPIEEIVLEESVIDDYPINQELLDNARDEGHEPVNTEAVEIVLEPPDPVTDFRKTPIYSPQVMNPVTNYLITDIMKDVVRQGTATRALQLNRTDLAGKTGTTNDFIDAWFSGFNNHTMTSVWVGFDQPKSLGNAESGARAALPIWIDFMATATAGQPNTALERPDTIVSKHINRTSGEISTALDPDAFLEIFAAKTAPDEILNAQVTEKVLQPGIPNPPAAVSQDDLF